MEEVKLLAPAKINLFLRLKGLLQGGYHEIETVFQSVSLFDRVVITLLKGSPGGIDVVTEGADIPKEKNIAYKAASAFLATYGASGGIRINISKSIPVGAGLGGGSSDAAAVLLGLNRLLGINAPIESLSGVAEGLGADVPYFLYGGLCAGYGRGDRIKKLKDTFKCRILIIYPDILTLTEKVYGESDKLELTFKGADIKIFSDYLAVNDLNKIASAMRNDLEQAVIRLHPGIGSLLGELKQSRALSAMVTGSGSAVYGIYADDGDAAGDFACFKGRYKSCFLVDAISGGFGRFF